MAIVDSNLVLSMPKGLCAASGIDVMTHALESMVSVMATDYTRSLSKEAGKLIYQYLPKALLIRLPVKRFTMPQQLPVWPLQMLSLASATLWLTNSARISMFRTVLPMLC